MDHRAPRY